MINTSLLDLSIAAYRFVNAIQVRRRLHARLLNAHKRSFDRHVPTNHATHVHDANFQAEFLGTLLLQFIAASTGGQLHCMTTQRRLDMP